MNKLLPIFVLAVTSACATPIHWFSSLDHFNFSSDERPMNKAYRFELGVFRDGFVPTIENRAEWSTYWTSAQRVQYNEAHGWYSGYLVVAQNDAPFTAGAEAWVWGFTGDASGGDWLLFRNPSWRWPTANPRLPVARNWNAKTANLVLTGAVDSDGAQLLRGEAIENAAPPSTTFEQWIAETGASADAENLIRFATGRDNSPVRIDRVARANGATKVEVRVPYLADRPLRGVDLEISEDLNTWHPYTRYARRVEVAPTEIVFELKESALDAPQLFFRSRYEP